MSTNCESYLKNFKNKLKFQRQSENSQKFFSKNSKNCKSSKKIQNNKNLMKIKEFSRKFKLFVKKFKNISKNFHKTPKISRNFQK